MNDRKDEGNTETHKRNIKKRNKNKQNKKKVKKPTNKENNQITI